MPTVLELEWLEDGGKNLLHPFRVEPARPKLDQGGVKRVDIKKHTQTHAYI